MLSNSSGIAYTNALTELAIDKNKNSKIVSAQQENDYNVLTHQPLEEENKENSKETILAYLGAEGIPSIIYIYPKDFESKDYITDYLDKYNDKKKEKDRVEYTDMAGMISSLSGNIMDAITIVLVAFSSISLIVSSIMIGIITYISVLERIKEIGILRAIGASKKDISRVFRAETIIEGLTAGVFGILITVILNIPINMIIKDITGISNISSLPIVGAIILVIISVLLTVIAGLFPARMASRKDPVEALRTE